MALATSTVATGCAAIAFRVLMLMVAVLGHNGHGAAKKQPNIVVIYADDLGYNDIGYRNPEAISPNLDRMAREGIILENNYVQPICTPSRFALMSGKYPYKARMQYLVLGDLMPNCVPTDIRLVGSYLKELGYATHLAGKWHLGFCQEECLPTRRGFDTFTGLWTGAGDQFRHLSNSGAYDLRNNEELNFVDNGTHITDVVRDALLGAIDNTPSGVPLFLLATFTAPHTPHQEPQRYIDMYPELKTTNPQRGKYLAMLTHMDEAVEDIVQRLKDKDLWENTLLVFSSDNGGEDGGYADNSPLRGSKASLWEGGTKVVGFVAGGLVAKGGTTTKGLLHQVDWLPTFVSLAGGTPDADLDGVDQTNLVLRGGPSKRDEIIYNIDNTLYGNFMANQGPIFGQAAIRLLHQVDWLPTFVSLAGGTPGADLDGVDQTNLILRGGPSKRDEIIYNIDNTLYGNFMANQGPIFGQAAIRQGPWKLLWGPTGYTDGYGLGVTGYWHIQSNLDLIGWNGTVPIPIPPPPRPSGRPCPPNAPPPQNEPTFVPPPPEERYRQRAINEALMFDVNDIDSGTHHLFNLHDDPNETNDLGQDPNRQQFVLHMKRRILELIENGYEAPDPEVFRISLDSLPCHFDGNAETGWCPNSDFDLYDME